MEPVEYVEERKHAKWQIRLLMAKTVAYWCAGFALLAWAGSQ